MKYLMMLISICYYFQAKTENQKASIETHVNSSERDINKNKSIQHNEKNSLRVDFEQVNRIKNVESINALNCAGGGCSC